MTNIVGIDLGTTFSSLAILNAIGKPEIIPNADGERLTPSVIYFDEENPNNVRVGIEALNSRYLNAQRSVRWVKRHMGDPNYHKTIDSKDWTPVELIAAPRISPGDTLWVVLSSLHTEIALRSGLFDRVVLEVLPDPLARR